MNEEIRNCDIPEEIKDICRSCENNIFKQNKGCAFRSLGNEYCDYVLDATRLYLKLQSNWNSLREWLENKKIWDISIVAETLDKMNELEGVDNGTTRK